MDEKIKYYYVVENKTMAEIGEIFGLSRRTISKKLKAMGAEKQKPPKSELETLYTQKLYTISQLQDFYGVGKKRINAWLQFYNIPIISGPAKANAKLRAVPLTKDQISFAVGTLLGDSCLSSSGNYKRISFGHSIKQAEWFYYKVNFFEPLTGTIQKQTQVTRNSTVLHFSSIGHPDFNKLYNLFYSGGQKVIHLELAQHLTPLSLAAWFMDDGNSRNKYMKLSTEGFGKNGSALLAEILGATFSIFPRVLYYNKGDKRYYYLGFKKSESTKLCHLIRPYFTPSMLYKLPILND